LLASLVWALIVGGGKLMLNIAQGMGLKWTQSEWVTPIGYALMGFAFFVILAFFIHSAFPRNPSPVTTENIETHVRAWADDFGFGYRRVPEQDIATEAIFAIRITLPSERNVVVFRPKSRPKYLNVQASIKPGREHQEILSTLSEARAQELTEEVRLELTRAGLDFLLTGKLERIVIVQRLPIEGLTEYAFMAAVDRVAIGQVLARDAFVVKLRGAAKQP
jgi:hypothetical protein